jgi:hypothetical protein
LAPAAAWAAPGDSEEPEPAEESGGQAEPPLVTVAERAAGAISERPAAAVSGRPAAARKPAPAPYKGLYYDNDFRYLDDPAYDGCPRLGEALKRLHCGDCWSWDLGGEYRLRHHDENNHARSQLAGAANDNNFLLERTRLFANATYGDTWRFYAEAIDATSSWEDVAPRTIEENRWDALNLFADALLWEGDSGRMTGRVGRQELLYGNQRLVSPLDWANTRRTFDGARLLWKGESWNVDGFWTRPVPVGQHVDQDHNFDHPDQSQEFLGLYSTCHAVAGQTYEYYYLRYAEYDGTPVNFDLSTLGARWLGQGGCWLWEIEGAGQWGDWAAATQGAGFYTLGLGRKLGGCWQPTLWAYYDWASGDRDPADGRHETFNQLFPLGHKYFGFMDLVGRQNIRDLNFLVTARPREKVELLVWWHILRLDEARDALYNASGAVVRQDASGAAGTDVGQELDVTLTFFLRPNLDLQLGYAHFFAGDFIAATGPDVDADFSYTQLNLRF